MNSKNFKILSHCLLVLEDLPSSIFQRKSKTIYDSLQHMIACSTFYLTDVLKRSNKRTLSNFFNLIGRKLLGVDDGTVPTEGSIYPYFTINLNQNSNLILFSLKENEGDENPDTTSSTINSKRKKAKQAEDKSTPGSKLNELKALEMFIAKTNAPTKSSYLNMLSGNEDVSQIYAYIANNSSKNAYKEMLKFRRRNNYFELLIHLLQKALNEEHSQEINEWSLETIEWFQKRNFSILGVQSILTRKQEGVIAVTGNAQKQLAADLQSELNTTNTNVKKLKKKSKIKKYKLLIPLDLDMSEKLKLEERQKRAIDTLYDIFPDRYEAWTRKKKLRKIFQEESAFRSQFYVIWALNNFSQLMNRLQASSPQDKSNFLETFYNTSYLDPQLFLFDKNNSLVINFDGLEFYNLMDQINKNDSMSQSTKRSELKSLNLVNHSASTKSSDSTDDKLYDIKDTCDLIADVLNGANYLPPRDDANNNTFDTDQSKRLNTPISSHTFIEMATNLFNKFKIATVNPCSS